MHNESSQQQAVVSGQPSAAMPKVVLIRWPFRILAGILALAIVPLIVDAAPKEPMVAVGMGVSVLQISMLALIGRIWPQI